MCSDKYLLINFPPDKFPKDVRLSSTQQIPLLTFYSGSDLHSTISLSSLVFASLPGLFLFVLALPPYLPTLTL